MRIPIIMLISLFFLFPNLAQAHFGIVIPSKSMIMTAKDAKLTFDVAFSHPFGGQGMAMKKPQEFFVDVKGSRSSLTETLQPARYLGNEAWSAEWTARRPGVYQFAVVPEPYFEESEDCFIIHYAKTAVAAFGSEDGWNVPLGLPVEIVPLTRPFANYAGNVFRGLVLFYGKPLANATVEIEFLNDKGSRAAPNEYFQTQTVLTDASGVFAYGIPWPGWWGFAALAESPEKKNLDGQPKAIELGGIYWSEFFAPQLKPDAK